MHKYIMLWTCDVCGKAAHIESDTAPNGWVQLGALGLIDRDICKSCAQALANRVTEWIYEHEEEPV